MQLHSRDETMLRLISREELKRFNGRGSPAYIACDGVVYDVSGSFLWKNGVHQVAHQAGEDLTTALKDAPHGDEVLRNFRRVGRLVD